LALETKNDPLLGTPFSKREGVETSAGIPLIVRNHKVGVMFVNYRHQYYPTVEDRTNMELFAHQAAVAIRNANLFAEQQVCIPVHGGH